MASAANGHREGAGSRECHGLNHILGIRAVGDHGRPPVDGAIPDPARLVVTGVPFEDYVAPEP